MSRVRVELSRLGGPAWEWWVEVPEGDYLTALALHTEHDGPLLRFPFTLTDDGLYIRREPEGYV